MTKPTKASATSKRTPRIIYFQGKNKQWYFHLKAANNETIFQSEGYKQKAGAIKGVAAIRKCFNIAMEVGL